MPRLKKNLAEPESANTIDAATGAPEEMKAVPAICRAVKKHRERLGMQKKELAERIGISGNAITNWESGRARPDLDALPKLCKELGIGLYELLDMENPDVTAYKKMTETEKYILNSYRGMKYGHKRALERACGVPDILRRRDFDRGLAAGIGDPTELDEHSEPIYLYATPYVKQSDYVFHVNGNSMEPDFANGCMVLVQKFNGSNISFGDVGAFITGNEMYIKEYQKDGLHSRNKDYPTMHFTEEQQKEDALRTERLEGQGYKVIRFTNERILCDTDNVISELRKYL